MHVVDRLQWIFRIGKEKYQDTSMDTSSKHTCHLGKPHELNYMSVIPEVIYFPLKSTEMEKWHVFNVPTCFPLLLQDYWGFLKSCCKTEMCFSLLQDSLSWADEVARLWFTTQLLAEFMDSHKLASRQKSLNLCYIRAIPFCAACVHVNKTKRIEWLKCQQWTTSRNPIRNNWMKSA